MDILEQLKYAEGIIHGVAGCVYCEGCRDLALQYISGVAYAQQLKQEEEEEKASKT